MSCEVAEVENSPLNIIVPLYGTDNSLSPFLHALKLAFASKGALEIVDVRSDKDALEHIGVRTALERWGELPEKSQRSDVMDAGLRIKKIVKAGNKKREVLKRLMRHGHDLMVIGIDRKPAGLFSFRRNISENLADNFGNTTLFLPRGSRSFVDENNGKVTLNSVIIPVKSSAFLEPALQSIKMFKSIFPSIVPHITCVHAGTKFPKICSTIPGISWDEKLSSEMPVTAILNSARSCNADLIIMVTQGRNSWSNYLAGSLTEQVLRKSPCPVLAITLKREV